MRLGGALLRVGASLALALCTLLALLSEGEEGRGVWLRGLYEQLNLLPISLPLIHGLQIFPNPLKATVAQGNQGVMCMALAAMGLETYLSKLVNLGMKPLILAGLS